MIAGRKGEVSLKFLEMTIKLRGGAVVAQSPVSRQLFAERRIEKRGELLETLI